jgi:hypothetical protein
MSGGQVVASEALRDRTGWIVTIGILQAALALLMLAFVALVLIIPMPPSTGSGARWPSVVFPGACGAALLVAAIGSILRKNWGRVASLVLSSLWLFGGLCALVFLAVLFPDIAAKQTSLSAEQRRLVFGSILGFSACGFVVLPSLLLLFYSRRSVRATFLAGSPTPRRPRPPVAIIALSSWLALGALGSPAVLLLYRPTAMYFGVVFHGPLAVVVILTNAAIAAGMAWGIWRQRVAAWWAALFFTVFGSASGVISFWRLDWWSMTRELRYRQPELAAHYFDVAAFWQFLRVSMALLGVLFVALVVYSRRYFQPQLNSRDRSVS